MADKILLFGKWDLAKIEVTDVGLQRVLSLRPSVIPHTHGRHEHKKFGKADVSIVERLANSLMHFGRKHAKNTGRMGGKKQKSMNIVRTALENRRAEDGREPRSGPCPSRRERRSQRRHNEDQLRWRRLSPFGGRRAAAPHRPGSQVHRRRGQGGSLFVSARGGGSAGGRAHRCCQQRRVELLCEEEVGAGAHRALFTLESSH